MQPLGNHIEIKLLPEPAMNLILEKQPLGKALVKEISQDIVTPFKIGDTVFIVEGRIVNIEGLTYIKEEYIHLYI